MLMTEPSARHFGGAQAGDLFAQGKTMPKLEMPLPNLELAVSQALSTTPGKIHPHDQVFSGLFGHGRVVELLKNAEGYAYGHRIQFENGMEAELLITDVVTRH